MPFPTLGENAAIIRDALEALPEGQRLHADYVDGLSGLGYTGSRGVLGYSGSRGATGFVGSRGVQGVGFAGSRGVLGFTGSRGVGFAGSRGATGAPGSDGGIGYSGSRGSIGWTGSRGAAGAPGSAGGIGFTGSRGSRGFNGSQGYQGSRGLKGDSGFVGSRGSRGFNGSKGELGYAGSRGFTGFNGSRGARGFSGSQGSIGFTGSRGTVGFSGSRGSRGFNGSKGELGFTGSRGTVGFSGSRGATGFAGSRGATGGLGYSGSRGLFGYSGSRGAAGTNGFNGSRGATGWTGSRGVLGFSGSRGMLGYAGSRGNLGFTGSRGALGFHGSRGSIGFTGSIGATGFTGSQGLQGDAGNLGFTGSIGFTGSQGATGAAGATGFIGSRGTIGYAGSRGFTGSIGIGFAGSRGATGYAGSLGLIGFTGSTGAGFTGSQGVLGPLGYTGSRGAGFTGSQGSIGYTGSLGLIGFTGSTGAGFTGSRGSIGFTGSQGIQGAIGEPGLAPFYIDTITDWEELPSSNNNLGDMYLLNGNQVVWIDGDLGEQWLELPYRGGTGFTGSQGAQGVPAVMRQPLGVLESVGELPSANSADPTDAYIIDTHLWAVVDGGWEDFGSFTGPTGDAGVVGYTGSRGIPSPTINIAGQLEDLGDLPAANSVADYSAYVVGSELHFNAANVWINAGRFAGYVGSVGYTGSQGASSLANTASGGNTAIQFNDSNVLAGNSAFTFNKAANTVTLTGRMDLVANAGIMQSWQQSGNTAGRVIQVRNDGMMDGFSGIRFRASGSGGTDGVLQVTSADTSALTFAPSSQRILGSTALNLWANGSAALSISGTSTTTNTVFGDANTVTNYFSSTGSFNFDTTNSLGIRLARSGASSVARITGFVANTTAVQFDINGNHDGAGNARITVRSGSPNTTPTFAFQDDLDTGINLIAADTLALITGGTASLVANNTTVLLASNTGLSFGSHVAASNTTLSDHIQVHGSGYGFNVTSASLNIVVPATASAYFRSGALTPLQVSNTAVLASTAGDETAPSYSFIGDTDIGMYRGGANILSFATSGVERLRLSGASIFLPTMGTSAGSVNLHANTTSTPTQQLTRSTSSIRYKRDVEDLDLSLSMNFIENARPVFYRSKSLNDNQAHSYLGFIAEELDLVEPRLVNYGYADEDRNEDGTVKEGAVVVPDGVGYDRMVVPIIQVVQTLLTRINTLEEQVALLQGTP